MAFVDEIVFYARAGKGGDGVVRWMHEKGKEWSGAGGGNGGKGGDVFVEGVSDLNILTKHRAVKQFIAENGRAGANFSRQGESGKDCIIYLPVGSVVRNTKTGRTVEILNKGEQYKILHGGKGGLGNEYFKASTNVRPEQSTEGKDGEDAEFHVELNLIADIGLIGLPNAGKSSLLNALTKAKAKVGNYAFTTLDPNLGVLHGLIVADIPGIIEGASDGKGLGIKFLKHVKRTKILLHLISLENVEEGIDHVYKIIRAELENYGEGLDNKPEMLILTKTDMVDESTLKKAVKIAKKLNKNVETVSVLDDKSIKLLGEAIVKFVNSIK
jgi:GTP-binding protein